MFLKTSDTALTRSRCALNLLTANTLDRWQTLNVIYTSRPWFELEEQAQRTRTTLNLGKSVKNQFAVK